MSKTNRSTAPRGFETMWDHYQNAVVETVQLLASDGADCFNLREIAEWLNGNTIRPFQIGIPAGSPVAIIMTPNPDNLDPYRAPAIEYGRIAERTEANVDMCGLECGTPSHRYAVYIERFWIGDDGTPESAGVCDYQPWEILHVLSEGQWTALLSCGLPYDPRDFTAALLDAERMPTKARVSTRHHAEKAA